MFSSFFSPTHGNCFTFNSGVGKEERNLVKSYKSGRQFGKAKKKFEYHIIMFCRTGSVYLYIHSAAFTAISVTSQAIMAKTAAVTIIHTCSILC